MDTRKGLAILFVTVWLGLSGCAAALIGAGAAGGYAISKDSVTDHFDKSKDRVFRSSLAVAKEMGRVTLEDSKNGIIKTKVGEFDVTITVKQITDKTTELVVRARNKFKMPKVDVAQDVYTEIEERLKKGWLF